MTYNLFFEWIQKVITSFCALGSWLTTPLSNIGVAPIWLLTATGLLVYLGFALVKWFLS